MRRWVYGWIAGAVALVTILALAEDIAKKQSNPVGQTTLQTLSAAQAAGADVTPTMIRPLTQRSKFQSSNENHNAESPMAIRRMIAPLDGKTFFDYPINDMELA